MINDLIETIKNNKNLIKISKMEIGKFSNYYTAVTTGKKLLLEIEVSLVNENFYYVLYLYGSMTLFIDKNYKTVDKNMHVEISNNILL